MSWNYRVISSPDPGGGPDQFGIHEVYYDSSGRVEAWTEESCDPFGESLAELEADVEMMSAALSKPVLLEAELLADLATRPDEPQIDANESEAGTATSGN